ncbi:uncharacterized protein [Dendrobates tinctorius]|uniref:uncharacterized protein n=1 Tax=Dendrobates tinctorius TaxID=92724 RepID=UPI003CC96D33
MTCHSQGCDSTGESQCNKKAEKRNTMKNLTLEKVESSDDFETIKEETSQVPSKMATATFLPPCKEIGDNDVPNIKAPMCTNEQKTENEDKNKGPYKTTLYPAQKLDNVNTTIKVATSERGDQLTQAGLNDATTVSRAKGAAEKQYTESRTEVESETEITTVGDVHKIKSQPEPMSDEKGVCSGHGYTTSEDKADETNDSVKPLMSQLSPCEASSSTSVKNVLLSTQDLIGSLTSLKEKLGKHDKMRSVNTENKQQCSSEDCTYAQAGYDEVGVLTASSNEMNGEELQYHIQELDWTGVELFCVFLILNKFFHKNSEIHEEPCPEPYDINEYTANMWPNLIHASVNSKDPSEQEEDPSPNCENTDQCSPQDIKEGLTIGTSGITTVFEEHVEKPPLNDRSESMVGGETGFKGKECLSQSTYRNREAEGMDLVNQGNRDWKQKWRSVCERQMDQVRRCDDSQKLESSISKKIKFQIIEKSKSDSAFYEQRMRQPSPTTTVLSEIKVQGKGHQTTSRHEDTDNGKHMDVIQESDGNHVTENMERKQPDTTTARGNNIQQGSFRDLTLTLLEATNSLIGRLESLNGALGRSQGSDSFISGKAIEQNVQDIAEQRFEVGGKDKAPGSLKMTAEESKRSSDINSSISIMDISTKTENYKGMNNKSMNSHPIQETIVDEYCRVGRQRQQERYEEKVESSEVMFSISRNLAIIQNNPNQDKHKQTDTKLEISTHSVETSYKTGNLEIAQMQFENQAQIFQEEMATEGQLIKHRGMDTPLTPVSIIGIDHTMPTEVVSNTSYCLKVSHTQVTDDPLAKWRSIVMSKIKVSSQHKTCELQKIKLDTAESTSVPSGNNNKDMNVDPLKQIDSGLNVETHPEHKRKEEQIVDSEMKDLGEMQTLRSYIRNGVIKRKREDPEDTEDKKQNKENRKEASEKSQDQLNKAGTTTSSDMYQGMGSGLTHLHQLRRDPWLKFWETTNQTLAVAAVTTTQTSTFFGHMAQVPANGVLVRNEKQLSSPLRSFDDDQVKSATLQNISETNLGTMKQECAVSSYIPQICSLPPGQAILQREKVFIRLSLKEQQDAMQRLRDLQREAEMKCASDRRRQMLRFQERLSIARNRKSELDLMDITQRRSPQLTPEPLAEGDVERQKSAVKEHLEKVKRERTYIMQTRRDRNMTSFKELLDPVLTGKKQEDSGSELSEVERH